MFTVFYLLPEGSYPAVTSTSPIRGWPAAKRSTFSLTRSANSGQDHLGRVSGVGGDEAIGQRPQGWPSGKGSGSVTSRAAPPIVAFLEGGDQGGGVDVAAPGHVDQPGVVPHQVSSGAEMMPLGLRGEGQGDENDLGLREH